MPLLTSTQYALLVKTGSQDDTLVEYLEDTYEGSIDDMFYQFLMGQGFSGSIQDMIGQWDGTFGATIVLDVVPNVAHDAPVTTVVATASVSNGTGVYTFSLTDNASGQFTINTTTGAITVNGALTTGDQGITIEADNGVDTPTTLDTSVSVNIAPANSVAPVVSGTPEVGETLSTSNGTWSGHPAPTSTYQWQRGGVDISGATDSTYTLTDDDDSTNVDCDVTGTNSSGSATAASNALSITYATPVFTTPASISGTNVVGNTLTANPGVASQPAGTTFTYQWTRDAVNIGSATSATYTLVTADENTDVTCVVTATTNNPGTATATSTPTAVTVLYVAPALNGSLTNQSFTEDTGNQTYDTSGGFTGNGLSYSLVSPPTGVTISSITGIVTHDSAVLAIQTGTTITVRATNNGGSVDQTYDLDITAAGGDTYALELDASNAGSFTFSSGSEISQWDDQSGNGRNATQGTVANQPDRDTSGTPFVHFDQSNDQMTVDFGSTFNGEVFQGTPLGVARYTINVVGGSWTFPTNALYAIDNGRVNGIIAVAGTASGPAAINSDLAAMGAGSDYSAATSMVEWFRGRTDITEIDVSGWDMSGVTSISSIAHDAANLTKFDGIGSWTTTSLTNVGNAFRGCESLTSLDLSGLNTSGVTIFSQFLRTCSSLTSIDLSNWDTSSASTFVRFARDCSSLTTVTINGGTGNPFADSGATSYMDAFLNTNLSQQSIDDILVAIEAAGTSSGTFGQTGGSAPSSTGEAAITALRGRGWTVSVTGGF